VYIKGGSQEEINSGLASVSARMSEIKAAEDAVKHERALNNKAPKHKLRLEKTRKRNIEQDIHNNSRAHSLANKMEIYNNL
jgi:hypothetical protein